MLARDLRVGDRVWLTGLGFLATISSITPQTCGYLKICYLGDPHVTEVHRETPLSFQNGQRYL